jgi:hypothetical protein
LNSPTKIELAARYWTLLRPAILRSTHRVHSEMAFKAKGKPQHNRHKRGNR